MHIRELFEKLVKKPVPSHISRSSAVRRRPQLEALENRLVLSDITGTGVVPVVDPLANTAQGG